MVSKVFSLSGRDLCPTPDLETPLPSHWFLVLTHFAQDMRRDKARGKTRDLGQDMTRAGSQDPARGS